jgi:lipopolysaccharide/colanic/teichoic acid biosynthesis glycosyltransferase
MPYPVQRGIAVIALVVLGPLLLVLAAIIRLTSPGPALHRAVRAKPGGTFTLLKLRSMRMGAADSGPGITAGGDPRVTSVGRVLRRSKLDELPQLWNVVRGDMALVGPRPEDPRYVDLSDPLHALVFNARPGITGAASVAYRSEEFVLAKEAMDIARTAGREEATGSDVELAYRDRILPAKLALEADYLRTRSWRTDLDLVRRTVLGD